jgi:predicted DNA binding protein
MQIEITMEAGRNLPGYILQDFFTNCEFVSKIGWTDNALECYLKVDFDNEDALEIEHPSFTVLEVISKSENSAIIRVKMDGPVPHLFSEIKNVWWVHPTRLDMNKFTVSIRGTTEALRQVRNAFKELIGNGFTVKLGAESLQGPEFKSILPQKQRLVLETAIEMGYYSRPRRCTQRDIAKVLDIKQATVSEHLQSAESKIINSFQS